MTRAEIALRLGVSVALLLVTGAYLAAARSFEPLAGYVPLLAGGAGFVLLSLIIVREVVRLARWSPDQTAARAQTVEGEAEIELSGDAAAASLKYIGSMLLLLLAVWQVGLLAAGPVFATLFLWLESGLRLRTSLAVGVATFVSFVILNTYLDFALP
jgi:hypothetical protein